MTRVGKFVLPRKIQLGPFGCGVLFILFIIGSIVNALTPDLPTTSEARPTYSASAEPTATDSPTETHSPTPTPTTEAPAASGTALAVLETLPVKELGPQSGYDRVGDFGEAWIDVDGNGCDTRNDILRRDFEAITEADSCTIRKGVIDDPYTGATINFTRGRGTSNAVQIDHIVALSNAWKTGATTWTEAKRIAFANDPLNLVAVDGPTNGAKGDDSADWWLPPRRQVWCWYVAHQVSVKYEYGLWITADEKVAMKEVLTTCPNQESYTSDYPERVAGGDLYIP